MIPSEAPLLHNQVKLVDPVDRQAHGPGAEGFPPCVSAQVLTMSIQKNGGLRAPQLRGAAHLVDVSPPPVTPVQMEQRQDGDLFTLTF